MFQMIQSNFFTTDKWIQNLKETALEEIYCQGQSSLQNENPSHFIEGTIKIGKQLKLVRAWNEVEFQNSIATCHTHLPKVKIFLASSLIASIAIPILALVAGAFAALAAGTIALICFGSACYHWRRSLSKKIFNQFVFDAQYKWKHGSVNAVKRSWLLREIHSASDNEIINPRFLANLQTALVASNESGLKTAQQEIWASLNNAIDQGPVKILQAEKSRAIQAASANVQRGPLLSDLLYIISDYIPEDISHLRHMVQILGRTEDIANIWARIAHTIGIDRAYIALCGNVDALVDLVEDRVARPAVQTCTRLPGGPKYLASISHLTPSEQAQRIDEWIRTDLEVQAVTMLDLSSLNLGYCPPAIFTLRRLTRLNLPCNGLRNLPPEIGQLTSLQRLNLMGNELTELPPEIGQLSSLYRLIINANRLNELPAEIGQLAALRRLEIRTNQLLHLPKEIGQLAALRLLNVQYNQLQDIPREIGNLTKLAIFRANNNRLQELPNEIRHLAALIELDVSNNLLQRFPIDGLPAIGILIFDSNPLVAGPAV